MSEEFQEIREQWDSMVIPYYPVLAEIRFTFLERTITEWPDKSYSCCDFFYDDKGTFLDLLGIICAGIIPKGIIPGFNGMQFNTWLNNGKDWVITNAQPDDLPRPKGLNAFIAGSIYNLVFKPLLGKYQSEYEPIIYKSSDELKEIYQLHISKIEKKRGNIYNFTGNVLDQRFELVNRLDNENTEL